jgi:hypothetical protein
MKLAVVKQALKAVRDAVDLKAELGLPVLDQTPQAILPNAPTTLPTPH